MKYSRAELVACVEREITQRLRVYERLVLDQKMSRRFADEEIAKMREVLIVVRALPDDEPQPGLFGKGCA